MRQSSQALFTEKTILLQNREYGLLALLRYKRELDLTVQYVKDSIRRISLQKDNLFLSVLTEGILLDDSCDQNVKTRARGRSWFRCHRDIPTGIAGPHGRCSRPEENILKDSRSSTRQFKIQQVPWEIQMRTDCRVLQPTKRVDMSKQEPLALSPRGRMILQSQQGLLGARTDKQDPSGGSFVGWNRIFLR